MYPMTDGSQFLHPSRESTAEMGAARFGPVASTLDPRETSQWWSLFSADDRLTVRVDTSAGSRLRVELLDQRFRVVSAGLSSYGSLTLEHVAPRRQFVYVRVHNVGDHEAQFSLNVRVARGANQPSSGRGTSLPSAA